MTSKISDKTGVTLPVLVMIVSLTVTVTTSLVMNKFQIEAQATEIKTLKNENQDIKKTVERLDRNVIILMTKLGMPAEKEEYGP